MFYQDQASNGAHFLRIRLMQLKERQFFDKRQLEEAGSGSIEEQNWEGRGLSPVSEEEDLWEDAREVNTGSCLPLLGLLAYNRSQTCEVWLGRLR